MLLFPSRGALEKARNEEETSGTGKFDGDVWWIKQTASAVSIPADAQISNACGSIGLLHALLNLPDTGAYALEADSPLKQFKAESLPLDGESRRQDPTKI